MSDNQGFDEDGQGDLFGHDPAIKNLGISHIILKTGQIQGTFTAATEAEDLAQLTPERWAWAYAECLYRLCVNDIAEARKVLNRVNKRHQILKAEQELRDTGINNTSVIEFRGVESCAK